MILNLFEVGYRSTPEQVERAKKFCLEAGSLDGLKKLHKWHTAFENEMNVLSSNSDDLSGRQGGRHAPNMSNDILGIDLHYSGGNSTLPNETHTHSSSNSRGHKHSHGTANGHSQSFLQSTGIFPSCCVCVMK